MAAPAEDQGEPVSTKNKTLNVGASASQNFDPVNQICAHLHAYHLYASDTTRCVEANHYCSQINEDTRQCLIYDSPGKSARLIGIEYLISPRLYGTLEPEERKLWHSHVYEVRSGMLIMPPASKITPSAVWDKAENAEMEQLLPLYGKTYHLWQVDRGDQVPLGKPELMISFTSNQDVERAEPKGVQGLAEKTKERFGVDIYERAKLRQGLCPDNKIHPDADSMLKK